MNRAFVSVIRGGFGGEAAGPAAGRERRPVKPGSAGDAARIMVNAFKAVVVPGYGMPEAQAWKAGTAMFVKRSPASGYAGIDNPLFYRDNTLLPLGDAKTTTEGIVKAM